MTEHKVDDWMQRVLLDGIKMEWKEVLDMEVPFHPSEKHQSQIRAMKKNPPGWAERRSGTMWQTVIRSVAVAVLIMAIGIGSILAISPSARAAVHRWIVEWYETHIVYRYLGMDAACAMPHYELTNLPEGYTETDRHETEISGSVMYENGIGGIVCFDYNYLQQGGASVFDPNDNKVVEVQIGRNDGLLFAPRDKEDMVTLVWVDERTEMQFCIFASLDSDVLLNVAEHVRIKK